MLVSVRRLFAAQLSLAMLLGLSSPGASAADPAGPTATADAESPAIERLGPEACRALEQLYAYDPSIPLEARTVEKIERDAAVREKIVFRGVHGFLVPGYLERPSGASEPRPCVLLLHGWSGSKESWWQDANYISGGNVRRALLEAGFAILALDAQCHGDRIAQNDFAPVNHYVDENATGPQRRGYFTQVEIYTQTTRDYRRAIDYLATREDIDAARIGAVGYSMGGTQTYLLAGVDARVKVVVAVAAPAESSKWSPIAPQNFLRAIGSRPFLAIAGRTDPMCSVEHAEARQALLGPEAPQVMFFDAGHRLPADYARHAVAWIKTHL